MQHVSQTEERESVLNYSSSEYSSHSEGKIIIVQSLRVASDESVGKGDRV